MMIIRSEQMQVLAGHCRHSANQRLVDYLRQRFPQAAADRAEADLLRFVDAVRQAAEARGLEREDQIATWLDLAVMYGLDFAEAAWAAPILNDPELAADGKLAALLRSVHRSGVSL